MSKEPEKKAAEQGGSEIEYAFGRVPADKRKAFSTILVILIGYCISLSNFVTGATVGSKMSFSGTVWSIVVGNAILALVAVMVGIIGAKSGKTTLVLARNFLGKRSSAIMSVLIALSAVNWIAVNADTFANMILTNFKWWPLPVWLTAIIVVAIWAQSAIRGVKGLEIVSWLGAPAAVILAIASFIAIGTKTGFGAVIHYVPGEGQLTFAAGSTSIVGAWIFGCIVTPDVTRYAKNGKHVSLAAPIAVYVGLAMIELVGAMTAQATGNASFVAATAALGLGILVFVCAIFCVWTTQDNNIYSASLSLQNIFVDTKLEGKVKHAWLAIIVAALAAIFGCRRCEVPSARRQGSVGPPAAHPGHDDRRAVVREELQGEPEHQLGRYRLLDRCHRHRSDLRQPQLPHPRGRQHGRGFLPVLGPQQGS